MPEATIDLPLSFSVPEMFRDIDFTVSAEANTNKLIADLTSLDPRPADDEIAHAIVSQQAMYEMLSAAGAVYAGILLSGPTEQEREKPLSSVLLSVTARPSELSNEDTVHRLARTMGAIYPDAEVGVVRLPTGPAVLLTEESKVPQPVNLLNAGGGPTIVRQLHVFVPIPGRLAMADFAIATENIAEWENCAEILGQVCKTITFA
ncbi:hypothetical protein BX264_4149 [Streptomyces sp. 2333.5]|uniref:hypothetical protein n=1 Tax=Streptomyces TaxID=1883 RepID=UPI00089D818F|nr:MULTISPECIES: hypothetical protein [unclassified Streptomyces]PJJ03755.1 hypothetical protein BX264_4149 [Streptomyces sp. 2333.5]SEE30132.1 hypothetical protein SAMN05428943_4322 [Streptomyces sp. 2314.4]SEE57212.1 hypothetical protein SAMN05428942_4250 [Streptomyces sp. 2112.2]